MRRTMVRGRRADTPAVSLMPSLDLMHPELLSRAPRSSYQVEIDAVLEREAVVAPRRRPQGRIRTWGGIARLVQRV